MVNGDTRYFKCIFYPFGWSRSDHWFCIIVNRFWTMMKTRYGYRVCSYVDYFAAAPSMVRASTLAGCSKASALLDRFIIRYGITCHPTKGVLGARSQVIQHLGFMINTKRGTFGVPASKQKNIENLAKRIIRMARCNARRVLLRDLASFIRRAQSLRFTVPGTAFCLRA